MRFQRVLVDKPSGEYLPGFLVLPQSPLGGALLLHPYGAAKEHMLGLALGMGEAGWAALAVDLCGHGENRAHVSPEMAVETEAALRYLRHFGRTSAIGISLGGRLALMSSADSIVAISPAVVAEISERGKWMFENFPSPAVREPYPGYVIELLNELGPVPSHCIPTLVLYAERDIPAILEGAGELKARLRNAEFRTITDDLRPDIQHENGFIRYLPRWFNHSELKFNLQVIKTTAHWLEQPQFVAVRA